MRQPLLVLEALTLEQVKENVKATLTVSAKGSSGGEGPRTHVQGTMSAEASPMFH